VKITIAPTTTFMEVNGLDCRVWQGTIRYGDDHPAAGKDWPVMAWVAAIATGPEGGDVQPLVDITTATILLQDRKHDELGKAVHHAATAEGKPRCIRCGKAPASLPEPLCEACLARSTSFHQTGEINPLGPLPPDPLWVIDLYQTYEGQEIIGDCWPAFFATKEDAERFLPTATFTFRQRRSRSRSTSSTASTATGSSSIPS
jgi:hypothetical protein